MLFGREKELKFLEDKYKKDEFQFIPVVGRRRVGKTTIIKEFLKDKDGIYFRPSFDPNENLMDLSNLIYGHVANVSFTDMFWELQSRAKDKRFVFVIDEFTRLTKKTMDFLNNLQDFIDDVHEDSKLFIIICSSSINLMMKEVLGYKCPLYGRRTGMLKVREFDPWITAKFLKGFEPEDVLKIWGMVGGIPYYLKEFDNTISLEDNIFINFIQDGSYFEDEYKMAFYEDYDTPATSQKLISAVSKGCRRISEISQETKLDSAQTSMIVAQLCSTEILEKITPVDNPNGKSTRYCLHDHFLKFWYKHINERRNCKFPTNPDTIANKVMEDFNTDMGQVFEQICGLYLQQLHPGIIGKWWGSDKLSKTIQEIDLISTSFDDDDRRIGWFAECKYRNEKVGIKELETLRFRSALVKGYDEIHYVLFSKSGFSDELLKENVELYSLEDVLNRRNIGYEYAEYPDFS